MPFSFQFRVISSHANPSHAYNASNTGANEYPSLLSRDLTGYMNLARCSSVYFLLGICMQNISPVGTPEIGGLTVFQALEIIRGCRGLNILGGDLVEVGVLV